MFHKGAKVGKMEKGKGRKMILFATQIICAFFLFHLFYTQLFTFEATPSHQLKFTGRQILSDGKDDLRSAVKKDVPDHQSPQYLLTRLVGGEDRARLYSTGLACEKKSWSHMCIANQPVKIDTKTMKVHLQSSDLNSTPAGETANTATTTTVVKPYAMQENPYAMAYISPVTITTDAPAPPTCDHNHQHPAVIFSASGYTGNLFHEFNENLVPLFITTRFLRSRVHFVVTDYKHSFMQKYKRVFSRLTDHQIINPAVDSSVHCFPEAVIGLKYHKFVGINASDNPQGYYSMPDFREFIRETFQLKTRSVFELMNPPVLLLISRRGSRKFLNEAEMVKMMEELGFRVIVASSNEEMSNIEKFSHVLNSCSVMVGVHGAGLANEMFLPDGAVMIQVRPLALQYGVDSFYSAPCPEMGLKYIEYMIEPKESSLAEVYGLNHPVVANTSSVAAKGYAAVREIYLDKQDIRINLNRFRQTLIEALGLLGRGQNALSAY